MAKRPDATLMASWNWELISDKPLDWWLPRLERIKRNYDEASYRQVEMQIKNMSQPGIPK